MEGDDSLFNDTSVGLKNSIGRMLNPANIFLLSQYHHSLPSVFFNNLLHH